MKSAFLVGFLFIILGASTQSDTSWMFTLAGSLALVQGLVLRRKKAHPSH